MHRPRSSRGMVTAELAVGSLAAVIMVVMLSVSAAALMAQMLCADAASEIARQSARGDVDAVARARADVPPGASVTVHRAAGAVRVEVSAPVRFGPLVPGLTVRAEAVTPLEPGQR